MSPRRVVEFHCGHRFRWIRLDSQDKLARLAIGWAKCVEYSHVLPKWKVLTGPGACDIFSKKVLVGDTYGLCHVLLNFFEWFMGWYGYFFLFFLWK